MNLTVNLTGPLGESISVTTEGDVLGVLREWGRRGYSSGELPAGGLSLPLSMADLFDWTLIGARPYTTGEGEQAVMYRGQSYKRRELDENKKFKMARCIKYSRGAKSGDQHKEGEEGGTQYVTLIRFQGDRKPITEFCVPGQAAGKVSDSDTPKPAPQPVPERKPVSEYSVQELKQTVADKVRGTRFYSAEGMAELVEAATGHFYQGDLDHITDSLTTAFERRDEKLTDHIMACAEKWGAEERKKSAA